MGAGVPLVAQASVATPNASSVLIAARAALEKVTGVHITVASKAGKINSTVVVDIGTTDGKESITSGADSISIIVTPTYAYLSGSATGLMKIMGLSAAQVKIVGKKSLAMKAGTTPYNNFKGNLTSPALLALLPVSKGTTLSTTFIKNVKDYQLHWTTTATSRSQLTKSVLTLSATGPRLPIRETITSATGGGITNFSHWGEHVSVIIPAPSATVSYAKLFG